MNKIFESVLYVHLSEKTDDKSDFDEFSNDIDKVPCVKEFENNRSQISKILKNKSQNKDINRLMVLFYAEGLKEMLDAIPKHWPIKHRSEIKGIKERFRKQYQKLDFARHVGDRIESSWYDCRTDILEPPINNIRVITAIDLLDIFAEIDGMRGLEKFFLGKEGTFSYDSPKLEDYIVRLRLIGSRIPVFRMDQDVLFPMDDQLGKKITDMEVWVKKHYTYTQVLATILSANYEQPAEGYQDATFDDFSQGFATRVNPCLLVPNKEPNYTEIIAKKCFDKKTAIKFFDETLPKIGTSKTSVISGALLFQSDSCVMTLPPFSNVSHLIMWIDDHLRYVLHRELGDFSPTTVMFFNTNGDKESLSVRNNDVRLKKNRANFKDFHGYTVNSYLPTLLYGCIFNDWLCKHEAKILMSRRDDLKTEEKKDEWDKLKKNSTLGKNRGPLTKAIFHIRMGNKYLSEEELRHELFVTMDNTIKRFYNELKELKTEDGRHTLASAWVSNDWPKNAPKEITKSCLGGETLREIEANNSNKMYENRNQLVDDAIRYVDWCDNWPKYARTIHSVPQGEFRSDLTWKK